MSPVRTDNADAYALELMRFCHAELVIVLHQADPGRYYVTIAGPGLQTQTHEVSAEVLLSGNWPPRQYAMVVH